MKPLTLADGSITTHYQMSHWKNMSACSYKLCILKPLRNLSDFLYLFLTHCVSLSLALYSVSQLRSAGAAIIQDLFPRVSCISTLDISDNGVTSNCRNQMKLLSSSSPSDLQPVSLCLFLSLSPQLLFHSLVTLL